jgi:hypothetical protein
MHETVIATLLMAMMVAPALLALSSKEDKPNL